MPKATQFYLSSSASTSSKGLIIEKTEHHLTKDIYYGWNKG